MAIALVQSATGTSMLATTTASFSVAPTSGNLIVLGFAGDDYNGTPDAGWTQSTGLEQQTFHGGYLWWRISNGSNSLQYTIGSANRTRWVLMEFSGVDATPFDISNGTYTQASVTTQATPSIIPTTGNRLLVAGWGFSNAAGFTGSVGSASDSFTGAVSSNGAEVTMYNMAYRLVTGNGSTGYSSTWTITAGNTPQSLSGLIISLKEAVTSGSPYSVVAAPGSYAVTGSPAIPRATWGYVGVSTVASQTGGTTLTMTEPTGVLDGDLLVACIASRSTATTAPSATGWTAVNSVSNNNTLTTGSALASGAMLYQIRSGTPTLVFTLPTGNSIALGHIVAYRGVKQTTPLVASTAVTTAVSTLNVSVAGLTTTGANDLIVAMAAGGQEAAWSSFNATTPSGASGATSTLNPSATWQERADNLTTAGADTSIGVFDAVRTTAGATGNLTVTASVAAGHTVVAGAFTLAAAATAKTITAAAGSYAITGTPATFRRSIVAAPGSYAVTGTPATMRQATATTATTNVATVSVGNVSVTALANISVSATTNVATVSVGNATVGEGGGISVSLTGTSMTASTSDVSTDTRQPSLVPIHPAAFLPYLVR